MAWKPILFQIIFFLSSWIQLGLTSPVTVKNRSQSLSGYKNLDFKQQIIRLSKASEMKNFMDENTDPCEDFYQFACGGWPKINKASEGGSTAFFDTASINQSRYILNKLNETSKLGETVTDKKVKRFFRSCVKLYNIPVVKHKNKLNSIIEEFGSMPALVGNTWNGTHFNWLETVAKIINKYGIEIIIGVDVTSDFKNNSINRIYLGQATMALESKSMYVDETNAEKRQEYGEFIRKKLQKYFQLSTEVADTTAWEIVAFEVELAKGILDEDLKRNFNESMNLTTPDDMNNKYAPLNFRKFLKIIFGEDIDEPIYEYGEEFQNHMKEIIEQTPTKIVANYIFYQLVSQFFPQTSNNEEDQYEYCEYMVNKYFAKNLDNMMYRQYIEKNNNIEQDVKSIWYQIKNSFKRELNSNKLNWISVKTRKKAVEKLDAMKIFMNSYSNIDFDEEFKDLEINNADFIGNMINIYRHNVKKEFARTDETPADLPELEETLSFTPAYNVLKNIIKYPIFLLQPYYFWSENYPLALKFGTLGFLLGHELIHGFDDTGRNFDKYGNMFNWWDEESTEIFENRTKCFTEQYHEYIFGGRKLRKSEIQSENIADNGGLQIAYDAYLKWLDNARLSDFDLKNETLLPRLKYSNKQLFFISFAQVWCSDNHPTVKTWIAETDDHTPDKYRVNGVVSNYLEFAKEFNCTVGTKMHPRKSCEIY